MVVDRSGSMNTIRHKAETGVNSFISEQKAQPETCSMLLKEFDNLHNVVFKGDLKKYKSQYILSPRNSTALRDAIGLGIKETDAIIKKSNKKYRPQLVVVCIVTDGGENASNIYTDPQIRDMVSQKQSEGWKFIYLCADHYSLQYGKDLGIQNTAQYNTVNTVQTYEATNSLVSRMRTDSREGRVVQNSFTARELDSIR